MAFDWEKYKEEIEVLYLRDRLTLVALKERLAREHTNFNPSISSYRTKLREWRFLRKNDRSKGSPRPSGRTGQYARDPAEHSGGEDGIEAEDSYAISPGADPNALSPTLGPWRPIGVSSGYENILHPRTPPTRTNNFIHNPLSPSALGITTSPSSFESSAPTSADPSPSTIPTSPDPTISPTISRHSPIQGPLRMADPGSGHMTQQHLPFPHQDPSVNALDHPVDKDGNTLLHMAAKNGPTWEFLAVMMRKTANIKTVNAQGETFFHVLDASRMQDIGDAESFLNLCDKLGYNFTQPSATGINGLDAFYQKWPDYTVSMEDKGQGFTHFTIRYNSGSTGDGRGDHDVHSNSPGYSELPNLNLDFELFENSEFF